MIAKCIEMLVLIVCLSLSPILAFAESNNSKTSEGTIYFTNNISSSSRTNHLDNQSSEKATHNKLLPNTGEKGSTILLGGVFLEVTVFVVYLKNTNERKYIHRGE